MTVGPNEASALTDAISVIDRLLGHLDAYYQEGERWLNEAGEQVFMPWFDTKCFGLDHELYDDIYALRAVVRRLTPRGQSA